MQDCNERLQSMSNYMEMLVRQFIDDIVLEYSQYFIVNKERITNGLVSAMKPTVDYVKQLIENNNNECIKYMHFSFLFSAALMNELKLKFDLYDTRYYGDISGRGGYWEYSVLFPSATEDINRIRKELSKQFISVRDYEFNDLRLYYYVGLFSIVERVLKELVSTESFIKLISEIVENDLIISYGSYLDQSLVIAILRKEGDEWSIS